MWLRERDSNARPPAHETGNLPLTMYPKSPATTVAEDERFERSYRVAAIIGLACRANRPLWQSSNKKLAENEGFEPSRPEGHH